MLNSRASLALFIILFASLCGFRPSANKKPSEALWLTTKKSTDSRTSYFEIDREGQVLLRLETAEGIKVKRGKVKNNLAADLFRETANSPAISSRGGPEERLLAYSGELLALSARTSGELKRVEAQLDSFGEAFAYAFSQARDSALKLPDSGGPAGFLTARIAGEADLQTLKAAAAGGTLPPAIETYEIRKIPQLFSAITQPHRLIPLERSSYEQKLKDFISLHKIYGRHNFFIISTTRGIFVCRILPGPAVKTDGKK